MEIIEFVLCLQKQGVCFPEFTSLQSSELGVPEKNILSEFRKMK